MGLADLCQSLDMRHFWLASLCYKLMAPSLKKHRKPTTVTATEGTSAAKVCQRAKTCCKFKPGAVACNKCMKIGEPDSCIPQQSCTRSAHGSSMLPVYPAVTLGPVVLPQEDEPGKAHVPTASQPTMHKHTPSTNTLFHSKDNSYNNFQPPFPSNEDAANPDRVKEFFSILSVPGGSPADADSILFEPEDNEENEDFANDIDNVSQNLASQAASESEGSEDIFLSAHLPQAPWQSVNKKPATKPAVAKGKGKHWSIHTNLKNSIPLYDPQLVVFFTIPCFILQHNGTNSPFEITSNITYDNLCLCIAEKLGIYQPGLLQLQYRLDSNHKQAMTSVQLDEELVLFKAHLHPMLMSPLLSSGQPSCSCPKNISVYSEDKMIVDEIGDLLSNGKGSQTTKTSASGSSQHKQGLSTTTAQLDGVACRLGQWAIEIMKDTTGSQMTVENIPSLLWEQIQKFGMPKISNQAWGGHGHSQAAIGLGAHNMYPAGGPHNPIGGYSGYYAPPTQAPIIIMQHTPWGGPDSPWYLPGHPSQHTAAHPLAVAMLAAAANPQATHTQQWALAGGLIHADSSCSTSSGYSTTMTHAGTCTQTSIDNIPNAKTPEIIGWFASLNQHEECKKDDIKFSSFGAILYDEGFCYLSQLSPNLMTCDKLASLLHSSKGVATFIRCYAKQDLEALFFG
ncbi:hypothetical protein BJV74DRAFT_794966 [Russula compacta]|nr:hypothetical protein BJV74DRAFT_794966 [Russula compacta]